MLESAKTRVHRFEQAVRHLAQGQPEPAREILAKLVSEDPESRRYRHKLHYATGLAHRDAGRLEHALRELERAVALDPESSEAQEALRKVQERSRGGLFSKIFGRKDP